METAASSVDPFLVEALQNPRHRLTILRMELDIQNFLRNSKQQQFEFQHFPTSYLRLAAHRVAQHYGLLTMVQDYSLDGQGMKIVVKRLANSSYPAVCLSDVPVQQSDNDKLEQKKFVIRPRPKSSNGSSELEKRSSTRTVEERKEEYDRARARIFSGPNSPESEDTVSQSPLNRKIENSVVDESEASDLDRNFSAKDGSVPSRVAIFRDREKDRSDPDYDRSYNRYVRNVPNTQNLNLAPFNMQSFHPPYLHYDSATPQLGQLPSSQASIGYSNTVMSPYCAIGLNQTSRDAVYMQWPSHAMMYPQPYDQFTHAVFQAPFCQQPLSFEYSHNY
ncbi:hypothetical protein DCAR_0310319 [Daucus carota subsp. sativus]|uniref:SUZ domain-containing protein n=1 Tax=Daucus carota subsp. sativus TaxID=79200 RepID=A0AAF0WKK7_DAUCS|nr:PREDICTED: R3H domain-containing protein 1-like [Daucus carota subsp. sativus]WOG91071.1 hypothetical protein DCAR_0310319 [Daucus carota subsp. sativus]